VARPESLMTPAVMLRVLRGKGTPVTGPAPEPVEASVRSDASTTAS
jgi:hypothetical protein